MQNLDIDAYERTRMCYHPSIYPMIVVRFNMAWEIASEKRNQKLVLHFALVCVFFSSISF